MFSQIKLFLFLVFICGLVQGQNLTWSFNSTLLTRSEAGRIQLQDIGKASNHCSWYAEQQRFLENVALDSLQRVIVFDRAQDFTMKQYFQIRLFMADFFLQKLTILFKNNYEGGGQIDRQPIQCLSERREIALKRFYIRDQFTQQLVRRFVDPDLLAMNQKGESLLEKMMLELKNRDPFAQASRFMVMAGLTSVLKRPFVVFGSSALIVNSVIDHSESYTSYHGDLADKDPEALWAKTMARIHSNLGVNLGGALNQKMLESFKTIQSVRQGQNRIHESSLTAGNRKNFF